MENPADRDVGAARLSHQGSVSRADALLRGELRYFSIHTVQTGFPPNWHRNPFTGQESPRDTHWSRIGDFAFGDIKLIWEPSRFSFVYDLVRAYWRTGDNRYAEGFWQSVEDWRKENPPQRGVNWKCGQEIAFRIMAWCFGLYGFLDAPATTASRVALLGQMVVVSACRIEAHIDYALSLQSNHSISEALGLWTVGTLFPEFKPAERWERTGRAHLEKLAADLIYPDGAFVQHSLNYHRVLLHDYLWAIRLAELNDCPFSDELKDRVVGAASFLRALVDENSGEAPIFGQNDGALILPLNDCDYLDFRPAVQAALYGATGERAYGSGPWDEDLVWLFGREALGGSAGILAGTCSAKPPAGTDAGAPRGGRTADAAGRKLKHATTALCAREGGYFKLPSDHGFAMVHCATFRHRPSQADLLHVDIWWNGQAITLDPGTFSYNAPNPWNNALSGTGCHNTVTADGLDQMEQVSKFLWVPWAKGKVRAMAQSEGSAVNGEADAGTRTQPKRLRLQGEAPMGTQLERLRLHPEQERASAVAAIFQVAQAPRGSELVVSGQWSVVASPLAYWEGEHDGYKRLRSPATHRRALIQLPDETWLVLDQLKSRAEHDYRLHWLFPAVPYEWDAAGTLRMQFNDGFYHVQISSNLGGAYSIASADPHSTRGWQSRYYYHREPALSLDLAVHAASSSFWSLFSPKHLKVKANEREIVVSAENWIATVELDDSANSSGTLARSIQITGWR